MFLNLFSTIKKNTYEVTSDNDEPLMFETNTDIDTTSKILKKENDLEVIQKNSRIYTDILIDIGNDLDFINKYNRLFILFLILTPICYFGFNELFILNLLLEIATVGLTLGKIIIPFILGTKGKLTKKRNYLEQKIHDNQEQIEIIKKEIEKLKKKFAYHELEEVPQITLSELPVEQRTETIQIRKLTKSHIKR